MSIDFLFDEWSDKRGIKRTAEVVPEHECQVFDGEVAADEREQLDTARETIRKILSN